jgi:CRISPR-associated protein Cmr6
MTWTWQRSNAVNTTPDNRISSCRHPGLILDRFAPQEAFGTGKRDWLTLIAQIEMDAGLLKAQRERWLETVEPTRFNSVPLLQLQTASRLIVGLGAEHALETAITLDRSSGTPLIPGSALKGVARTFALIGIAQQLQFTDEQIETALNTLDDWLSKAEIKWDTLEDYGLSRLDQEQKKTLSDWVETFRSVFGFLGAVGRAIFFNASYAGNSKPFEVDVMTPHFGKYYIERAAPSDDQNPVPVPYLVVRENQTFWFAVGAKTSSDVQIAKQARFWLREGLIAYGVGAKTAQGYGIFQKPPQRG